MSGPTCVVIVRHGQSWTNPAARGPSASSLGLTGFGVGQARQTAEHLASDAHEHGRFDAIYISPRRSCLETAEPFATALGIKPVVAQELRSLDHGPGDPWDPSRNAVGTLPPLAASAAALAGAETWEAYQRRTGQFLAGLPQAHPVGRVLIIGHAGTQCAAMTQFLRLPLASGRWWHAQLDHGGICRWTHEYQDLPGADRSGSWVLVGHNQTAHLHRDQQFQAARPGEAGT